MWDNLSLRFETQDERNFTRTNFIQEFCCVNNIARFFRSLDVNRHTVFTCSNLINSRWPAREETGSASHKEIQTADWQQSDRKLRTRSRNAPSLFLFLFSRRSATNSRIVSHEACLAINFFPYLTALFPSFSSVWWFWKEQRNKMR